MNINDFREMFYTVHAWDEFGVDTGMILNDYFYDNRQASANSQNMVELEMNNNRRTPCLSACDDDCICFKPFSGDHMVKTSGIKLFDLISN